MSAIAKTAYFWRSAAQGIRHAPFVHFIAVLTIAIALFTAGLARTGALWLESLLVSLSEDVELTVYLAADAADRAAEIAREVEARTGGTARVVSREAALARLADELGDLGKALDGLPENPLPVSLEVVVPPDRRSPDALSASAEALSAIPGVDAVDYGKQAVERLSAIVLAARAAGLVAFLIIGLATIVIVSATLQLAIYARREEIEIQKLVGATDRFVKAPFLIEGLLQGLLGSALAAAGLRLVVAVAGPYVAELLSFLVGPNGVPATLSPELLAELLGAGGALGLLGSFVAVGRFLRV